MYIPVLLYGLDVCALNKTEKASLDFVINRFFMKLFQTNNIELVKNENRFYDKSVLIV